MESYLSYQAIGIDAGGTLIKIACEQPDGTVSFLKFPTADIGAAANWIIGRGSATPICITGGKASMLQMLINREADHLAEFDATFKGAKWLLKREGIPLESFLLTNVGTGTSIHYINKDQHFRVGGTGVGGGTLLGLSALGTGITDFGEIVRLAKEGSRDQIDLKVSHIYEGTEPPIPGELTASNFGRWAQTGGSGRKEDVLASVVGLVGETVASISVHAAGQCGASTVMYIGSSFIQNDLLYKVVSDYTKLRGAEPVLVQGGEYSGAVGAMLSVRRE